MGKRNNRTGKNLSAINSSLQKQSITLPEGAKTSFALIGPSGKIARTIEAASLDVAKVLLSPPKNHKVVKVD